MSWKKRPRLKTLFLLLLIFDIFLLSVAVPVKADVNWLVGWDYRKSHTILKATGAGTNYQIKLTVHYGIRP